MNSLIHPVQKINGLPDHDLTGVELELLRRAAHGETNREIAGAMRTTEQTVKNRFRMICAGMRARNAKHAIYLATRNGWIL